MTSVAERAPATARTAAASPLAEIARDVARAGVAGLVAGVVVAGLGGRLVMRLAAVVVPASTGSFTENGNRIGDITVGGTMARLRGRLAGRCPGSLVPARRRRISGRDVRLCRHDLTLRTADGRNVTWCYVTDPEGNIVELQSWS